MFQVWMAFNHTEKTGWFIILIIQSEKPLRWVCHCRLRLLGDFPWCTVSSPLLFLHSIGLYIVLLYVINFWLFSHRVCALSFIFLFHPFFSLVSVLIPQPVAMVVLPEPLWSPWDIKLYLYAENSLNLRVFFISILVIFIGKQFVVDRFLTNYHNLDNYTDHDVQTELNILFSITETSKWGQKCLRKMFFEFIDWKRVFFFFCKLSPAGIWNESTFNALFSFLHFSLLEVTSIFSIYRN